MLDCATNLLRALCVDMLQRMLRLLLVGPDNIRILGLLPCLRIETLLDGVDVGDVVLPRARWGTPCLLRSGLVPGFCAL